MALFQKPTAASCWRLGMSLLIAVQGVFILFMAGYYVLLASPAVIVDMDFFQDYFAATQLAHQQNIYQRYPASFPSLVSSTDPLLTTGCFHHDAHPPLTALLFLPLSWLPARIALDGWLLVNIFLLGIALFIIKQRLFPAVSKKAILVFLVILLFSYSFMENILTGQLTILLFFLIVMAWRSARKGQQARAGLYLAIAALIHLTPALFLGYLAWKRQWRAVITAACAGAAIVVAALPWLPFQVYWQYFTQVSSQDVSCWASHFDNKSILGFLSRLFPSAPSEFYYPPPSPLAATLLIVTISGLLLLCLWLLRRPVAGKSDAARTMIQDSEWGLMMIAMLLISPLTWSHGLLMLCLPLLLLVQWIQQETGRVRSLLHRLLVISVVLLFITPNMLNVSPLVLPLQSAFESIFSPTNHAPLWLALTVYAAGLYGMLLLFGLYVWYRGVRLPHLPEEQTPQVLAGAGRQSSAEMF